MDKTAFVVHNLVLYRLAMRLILIPWKCEIVDYMSYKYLEHIANILTEYVFHITEQKNVKKWFSEKL